MYKWNAEDYKENSSNQYMWALDLISQLDLKGNEKILDIGCGDGKITAEIASSVPKGAVIGLDISKEMIEFSQKKFPSSDYPNLTFQAGDAKLLDFDNEFDLVVSFSCLLWVLDHKPVIEGIKKSLKSSGKIILQFPLFTPIEMGKIDCGQVMKSKKWLNYFENFPWSYAFYETNEYKALLEECGLKAKRVELKQTHMSFQGKEGLRGFIRSTLNSITARIPEELRQEFIGDLVDKSIESNPPDSAGFIYVPLILLEVEASKDTSRSMYRVASDFLAYYELFIPESMEPLILLQNLLSSGLFSNYVMYESKNSVRIAGNVLAEVSVSTEAVSLSCKGQTICTEPISDPLKQVESALASLRLENWTAYGYVGFDISHFYYPYSKAIQQPLLYFMVPETELHITHSGVYIKSIKLPAKVTEALFVDSQLKDYVATPIVLDFADKQHYQNQVDTLISAIQSGQLHKAIISHSVNVKGNMDILGTYALGAKNNNSARSYCLRLGDVSAVGFSPEIFIESTVGGFVVTNPLAGTRPRGSSSQEDADLQGELFTDAKEVKEHALSIWLAQSEMASVCLPQTVQVLDFMEVKKYRTVQHLSSRVGGQLKQGLTSWDAMKVLFPGVTVSGIDKHRALEWIDRLEDEPRGLYGGAIGYINSKGVSDLALAIRSAYQYGDSVYLNAGAGIVAESVPELEYIESVNKMNTMLTNLVMKS